ncbi:MAG: hypothetical protein IT425_11045 [Pirellulales bacterium]|nr:hypothetical protein [Pirellulales bacterium]
MNARFLTVVLLGLMIVPITRAEERPGKNNQAESLELRVEEFVKQLRGGSDAERAAAEDELIELADSSGVQAARVVALLPPDSDSLPPELRAQLTLIRKQIETRVANKATAGSTIRLSAKAMPFAAVLQSIERQTGNKFLDNRQNADEQGPTITIELKNEPFWPAIDRILDNASLGIYGYGGEEALSIIDRGESESPRVGRAAYQGPFRIETLGVQAIRNFRQTESNALQVQLEVAWEPRLRPIVLAPSADDSSATLDSGEMMFVPSPEAVPVIEVTSGTQTAEIVLPFELPDRKAKSIESLHGKLRALVPGRRAKFRFDALPKPTGKPQEEGGVQVTLNDVRKNGAVWELHVRIAMPDATGLAESHRDWVFQNLSYLENAKGERIENAGLETSHQAEGEIGIVYLFDTSADLSGLTWVYESPVSLIEVLIEYELKNIDLP